MNRRTVLAAAAPLCAMPAVAQNGIDLDALQREVWDTELAFARTMAQRDLTGFERFLSPHTVFWSGTQVLRGSAAVVQAWRRFYDGAQAPFAWEPDAVVVIGDGTLATSTGPVRAPDGKVIARFRSLWRREPDGRWLIVLDRGEPADARP
ncbi:MAG TPA: nuclear transport factor 2 family protein [Burkholderiaceae bacterium]|nr:nuclear transport factor 2 family protein [Burkholderiaceae bacterium]